MRRRPPRPAPGRAFSMILGLGLAVAPTIARGQVAPESSPSPAPGLAPPVVVPPLSPPPPVPPPSLPTATAPTVAAPVRPPAGPNFPIGPNGVPDAGVPRNSVPNVSQRSGLITRFVPIVPRLPHDRDRDDWWDTRFVDNPRITSHQNYNIKNSGLYGLGWKADCTATVYPYFFGTPGGTVSPDCRRAHPALRLWDNLVHPFHPVGMYYDQGCYVPIVDLDPLVPGPGPSPVWFPWYLRNPRGG